MYSGGVNRQEAQHVHGWESSQIGFLLKTYDAIRTRLARAPEAGAAAGFSVIFLIFALATPDTFLSHSAISSILNSQAVPGILAIGITLRLLTGQLFSATAKRSAIFRSVMSRRTMSQLW